MAGTPNVGSGEPELRSASFAAARQQRPPVAAPWMAWTSQAAIWWALAYMAVRIWWAVSGAPSFGPQHTDLVAFTGWGAVGLSAAALAVAFALKTVRWWPPLFVAAWAIAAALFVASAMLLLDVVGGLLPGIGLPFVPLGFASRAACALVGALLAASAVVYRRHWRADCLFCGRTGVRVRPARTPWWAWSAAFAAIAGCLIRLGAQIVAGVESLLIHVSLSLLLFEAGFVLAGTLLPLALVTSWGRVFPWWVPRLAGRRVPRWLVLGPAFGIGGAMTAYFGFTLLTLLAATLTGTSGRLTGSFSPAFFWVAVPAYFVWGLGIVAAAIAYYRITRPICRVCGQ